MERTFEAHERARLSLRDLIEGGLQMAFEGLILFDDDLEVIAANAPAASVLGIRTADAMLGRPLDELAERTGISDLADRARALDQFEEEFSTEEPRMGSRLFEIRWRRSIAPRLHLLAIRDATQRRRRERGEAVYRAVTAILAQSSSPAEVLPKLLGALGSTLGFDIAELYRPDPRLDLLRREASWHAPGVRERLNGERALLPPCVAIDEGVPGIAWASGDPVWVDEIASTCSVHCQASLRGSGLTSALAFPVNVSGRAVAVLVFLSIKRRASDPSVLKLLGALNELIGQSIERMRLLDAEHSLRLRSERATERLRLIQGVATALARAITPGEVARIAISSLCEAMHAKTAVIYRFDAESRELVLQDFINYNWASELNPRISLDVDGPLTVAVRERRSLFIHSAEDLRKRFPVFATVAPKNFEAWIALPLIVSNKVYGGLGVAFAEAKPFCKEDRDLLQTIADQCALALDRSSLFEAERRAKERAEADRARFRSILMSAPIPVCVYEGPQHIVRMVNRAWLKMIDPDAKEESFVGKPLRAFPSQFQRASQQIAVELDRVHSTGERLTFTEFPVHFPQPDGSIELRYFDASASPIRNERGAVTGVVQMSVDVTEQVRTRQQHESARAEAEAATRAKDEFLATLSHELRTPLQSMLGWTQLLLSRPFDEDLCRRGIEIIERNSKQQAKLIDELLDVSRIVAGKILLDRHPLSLTEVLDLVIGSLQTKADEKGVDLVIHAPKEVSVFGDSDRLRQVFMNLIGNAIKFTPGGGKVTAFLKGSGKTARVIIQDTGQGMPPKLLSEIFAPFRQIDASSRRAHGGLGLGLAIVKHLVEQHGGMVWAESEGEGLGSRFIVELPVYIHRGRAEAAPPIEDEEEISLAGARILLVDDDMDAAEVNAMALRQAGAEVEIASAAEEAIERCWEYHPALLITDLRLGDSDGFELLERVHEIDASFGRSTPALALTGYAGESDRERVLDAGFEAHIPKPIPVDELVRTVARALKKFGIIEG